MPIHYLIALFLGWLCAGALYAPSLYAQSQDAGPLRYRVRVEAPAPFAAMLTDGLAITRWQHDPQMTTELLQRLVDEAAQEARQALAAEGYFAPSVEAAIERDEDYSVVLLRVAPGERVTIGEVDLRVTGPAADDPQARDNVRRVHDEWRLRPGEPFRQESWDQAKRQAVRELSAWRYAAARVAQSEAHIDPVSRSATLRVVLDSGPPYRFGQLEVAGTRRYPEALVRNLSPLHAGETYDREKLVIYERRLVESGYFVSAHAESDAAGTEGMPDGAPVRVAVVEGNSQHVEAGVGYSTDVGARTELRYSNVDVFDTAWRFRSGLRLDQKTQNLQLELDSPPLAGGRWNSGFMRVRQADIQNERTRELAVGVAHNWGIERTPSSFIISGHLEEQAVAGDRTDNRQAVYFGHRSTFRRTDDLISPRSGYLGTIEVGGAPPALATRTFLRGTANATLFVPFGRSADLLVRGQVGAVFSDSREGIPSSFLFRTGGDQTVRGYALESIGIRQANAIVGGRRLAWGSVEYIHWIDPSWGVAGFVDAGDVWDHTGDFHAARGYGVGGRFRTPIGPIRADLAYGEETKRLRLHFSVGYVF